MCDQANDRIPQDKNESSLQYGAPCVKCKVKPITIIIRQAAYCSDCFQEVTFHKYRVNVFKTRSASTGKERAMVALSTGQASRLLLYFTQLPRIKDKNRRNTDTFFPVHVIEDEAEDRSGLVSFIKELELECIFVPLHAILSPSIMDGSCKISELGDEESKLKLHSILESAKTPTAKLDLVRIFRRNLLTLLAIRLNCKRIYLGETNDRLAINVMADVCAGRGAMVPWTQRPIQFFGRSDTGFVRPLREAQALEVSEFLRLIEKESGMQNTADKTSIYGLTDAFITKLAKGYSATPSIVTRTAAKIETENTPTDISKCCQLCNGPMSSEASMCNPCVNLAQDIPFLVVDDLSKFNILQ